MGADPSRIMALGHFIKGGADSAAFTGDRVATNATLLLEEPPSGERSGDSFHGDVVGAQRFTREAEDVKRQRVEIGVAGLDGRHSGTGSDRGRILEMFE